MKRSIGNKVISMMAVFGAVFLITVLVNMMAMSSIKKNNNMSNIYLEIAGEKNEATTAFEQMQLYANLIYFKQYDFELMKTKLESGISNLDSSLENMGNLSGYTDDDVMGAYDTLKSSMNAFSNYCTELLNKAEEGDFDTVGDMVTDLRIYIEPAQAAIDAYDALVSGKQAEIQNTSISMIGKTCNLSIAFIVLFLIVMALTITVVILTVARPAKKSGALLAQIVQKIENDEGDLTERILVKTKDEIGQMAGGINNFLDQLQGVMQKLKQDSDQLKQSVEIVSSEIGESNENASSVSAAMEQMSASMEEISATLGQLAHGSDAVLSEINAMMGEVNEGVQLVLDIKGRAQDMHQSTVGSKESAGQIIYDIRKTLVGAVEESHSVEQINELTSEILNITSKTNLLALNASIEAARAGEAGKGFAVVAEEIRVLADNSRDTANNIQAISNQVTKAVERLAENAEGMLRFIDEKILKDYDGFVEVVEQYEKDADSVNDILSQFADNTNDISNTMQTMNTGINDIAIAVDESAKAVISVAENAVSLVDSMKQIQQETENNHDISVKLSNEVNRFKKV